MNNRPAITHIGDLFKAYSIAGALAGLLAIVVITAIHTPVFFAGILSGVAVALAWKAFGRRVADRVIGTLSSAIHLAIVARFARF